MSTLPSGHADVVEHFAHLAANTDYEQLPPAAVDAAKKSVLDTLGVILAASGAEPAVHRVIALVREAGGTPTSTVLGFGDRVPAPWAAFANGAMAHCLDFDDQTPWGQHSASSVVPAALAIAEHRGGVSGRELITAIALGQDVFVRLRRNVGWNKDWNLSTVLGVYAGAATASYLLGLTQPKVSHAFGIASMQSAGVMEVVAGTGRDLRALYAGFSAKGAVLSAMLADKGVTGVARLFEGPRGVFATYFGGRYDRTSMLRDLGVDFQGSSTLYKTWPAVGTSHSHISATIDLIVEHDISADDIAEIRVHAGDYHLLMCEPLNARRAPATLVDAKFSLPFLVAVAAVRRTVRVVDLTAEGLRSPEVLAMAEKVVPVADSFFDWEEELPLGRVEVVLADGRRFARTGHKVPGSLGAPLTWEDLGHKFSSCATVAISTPNAQRIRAALRVAQHLENEVDVMTLIDLVR